MKVLFIVPYPTEGASNRVRIEQYLKYLDENKIQYRLRPFVSHNFYQILYQKGHTLKKVFHFLASTLNRLLDIFRARHYDVVFIHREAFPFGPPWLEKAIALVNPNIVFDFDDAIFLEEASTPHLYVGRLKEPQKFYKILNMSKQVVAGNDYLASFALNYTKNVSVIPSSIDVDLYQPNNEKRLKKSSAEPFIIGWIGSITTQAYIDEIRPLFGRLARRFPNVEFLFIGADYEVDGLPTVSKPWSLDREIDDLNEIDIGIMPMPDTSWTKGKCGFKAILYMSMGIPAVCSPVGVNKQIIKHGVNGFLPETIDEWEECIAQLISSPDLRGTLAREGLKTVGREYSTQANYRKFLGVLEKAYIGEVMPRFQTKVIVNADELGLTEQVNQAIIEAHRNGVVTSTSTIVNMWAFDDAIRLIRENPTLEIGLHLNLTYGRPISPPETVPTLVDRHGNFWTRNKLLQKLFTNRINLAEVKRELRAQIDRYKEEGLDFHHLDSHEHVHVKPRLCSAFIELAKEHNVPLRIPEETIIFLGRYSLLRALFDRRFMKKWFIRVQCRVARKLCKTHGVATSDHFFSVFGIFPPEKHITSLTYKLLFSRVPDGVVEVMTHPSYYDDRLRQFLFYGMQAAIQREDESRALQDPSLLEYVKELGIELAHHGVLHDLPEVEAPPVVEELEPAAARPAEMELTGINPAILQNRDIVCFSSIDWDFIWQGHQEIMSALANNGNRVLFVENTGIRRMTLKDIPRLWSRLNNWRRGVKGLRMESENLYVLSPLVLPFPYSKPATFVNRKLLLNDINRWVQSESTREPIVWTFLPTPLVQSTLKQLDHQMLLYYCIDNFAESSGPAQKVDKYEKSLLTDSDLVFVTSGKLKEKCTRHNSNVYMFPFAVNIDRFSRVRDGHEPYQCPSDLKHLGKPIIGYIGGIHKWIDMSMIEATAKANPNAEVVLIGPIQVAKSKLPRLPNVHWLGQRPHGMIPHYVRAFDVGIIPYRITEYTRSVYPTKLNEYLSMGKPVVSTPLPEITRFNEENNGVVTIAEETKSFALAVSAALQEEDSLEKKLRRISIAEENTWSKTIMNMSTLIRQTLHYEEDAESLPSR
jgi:predicted glycoside hydrolase/deacetylase ChbG (UPF0249 family)